MSGVTADTFDQLHKGLAEYFIKALTSPNSPVGLIKEAREFLKDNNIQGKMIEGNALERLSRLPAVDLGEAGETPLRLVK